jgi:hypothetical protein
MNSDWNLAAPCDIAFDEGQMFLAMFGVEVKNEFPVASGNPGLDQVS